MQPQRARKTALTTGLAALAFLQACRAVEASLARLLTFGSPLGTLFTEVFPAYFDDSCRQVALDRIQASGGRWINLFRSTDAISGPAIPLGGPVADDRWLEDPRVHGRPDDSLPDDTPARERTPAYGVASGHGQYLADPAAKAAIDELDG